MSESLPQSRLSDEEISDIACYAEGSSRRGRNSIIRALSELNLLRTIETDRDIALQAADNAIQQTVVLSDRVTELEALLIRTLPYIEPEVAQEGYGFFPGGDPTKFFPDTDNSLQEIENWQEACKRWNKTKVGEEGSHRWLTDSEGNVIGTATVANLGMGIYTYEDEEAKGIVSQIKLLQGAEPIESHNPL